MPPTKPDAAPAAEEAAAKTDAAAAAAAAPSSGGIKAWLPLIITVVLMPVLAYAMTAFVLVPRVQAKLGGAPAAAGSPAGQSETKKSSAPVKKESVLMNKLLVNVAGTMGSRYLLVSLSLVGTDPDMKDKIQTAEPQMRDMACGALSTKTLADLEKPGIRNLIRNELLSGFNTILGGQVVQEIYLTEFAIQ
jgi:flagellar FliL protein